MHLTKHMSDNMDPNGEENAYRKRFGNLKQCCTEGKLIMAFFKLDGTAFKFQKWENIVALNESGQLEAEAWEKAQEGHVAYLKKRGQYQEEA